MTLLTLDYSGAPEVPQPEGILEHALYSAAPVYILIRVVLIITLTFLVAKLISKFTKNKWTEHLHYLFFKNITILILYLVGIVMALYQIPSFNNALATVLAGSGIVALSVGLAAQESLGNFINGLVISIAKPFEAGDRIHLINGNITGYIEDITMRHTVIRTFMNSRVIVPNSAINKDMIENSNFLEDKASGFIDVTITYDSDLELARSLMIQAVESHPDYVPPHSADGRRIETAVYLRGLSTYGVELRVSMWTASISNNFSACSDVRFQIKRAFDKAGIRFAAVSATVASGAAVPSAVPVKVIEDAASATSAESAEGTGIYE